MYKQINIYIYMYTYIYIYIYIMSRYSYICTARYVHACNMHTHIPLV